jgi:hypothetical protein
MYRRSCMDKLGGCIGCLGWLLFAVFVGILALAVLSPAPVSADAPTPKDPPPDKQMRVANICLPYYLNAQVYGHPPYVARTIYATGQISWSRMRMYDICTQQYPTWDWPNDEEWCLHGPFPTYDDLLAVYPVLRFYRPNGSDIDIWHLEIPFPESQVDTCSPVIDPNE